MSDKLLINEKYLSNLDIDTEFGKIVVLEEIDFTGRLLGDHLDGYLEMASTGYIIETNQFVRLKWLVEKELFDGWEAVYRELDDIDYSAPSEIEIIEDEDEIEDLIERFKDYK